MIYQINRDEYNEIYPEEKEYTDWITAMENDLAKGKLVVTNRTKIILDTEEYSPYSTINS